MKKIGKILLALFLVVSLCGNNVVYAGAVECGVGLSSDVKAKLNEQLFFISLDAHSFGMSQNDFNKLYIGNPVYSYECIDNSLQKMSFLTYPIFCDDRIVFFMIKSDDESIQLTKGFAEALTEYYVSGVEIALVYDDEKCYVVSENVTEELAVSGYQIDYRDSLCECRQENIVSSRMQPVEMVEYTGLRTRASYAYLAVPVVLQGDYNICWAASVASIGNYLTSYNYSAVDVARATYGNFFDSGASVGTAMNALNNIYGIDYLWSETTVLSDSQMYYNLIDGYPVYAKWAVDNDFHATVIRGILTDSYIMIMDPNFGFTIVNKSGNTYSYVSSSLGATLTLCGYGAMDTYIM